jgi:PAS domain S-box-containing protein
MEFDQQSISKQKSRDNSPATKHPTVLLDETTILQEAQQGQQVTEDRFRALVSATADLFWITSSDRKMEEDSASWRAFTGQNETDCKDSGWLECIHPDDQKRFDTVWKEASAQGQGYEIQCRIRRSDGVYRTFSLRGVPVHRANDSIQEWMAIGTDITERKQLEQRTHQTLEALLTMTEILVSHDVESDGEQVVFTTTEMAQRLAELTCTVLGCRNATILGLEPETGASQFVAAVGFSLEQEHKVRARIQGRTISDYLENPELASRLRAGEALVTDLTQLPYRGRQYYSDFYTALLVPMRLGTKLVGTIILNPADEKHEFTPDEIALATAMGKLAVLIIERERLLREREDARASELATRVAKQRLDEFLSVASHELRTPLTTIKGNIQLARQRVNNAMQDVVVKNDSLLSKLEEIKLMLERAERQTNVENRLVGDLLDVTRIQRNKLEIHKKACDLVQIVSEVVEEQCSIASPRNILVDLAVSEPAPVFADAERIGQVVGNFLSNAHKYSPSDHPIEVSMQVEKQRVRVSVRDEGPGLPPKEQERIWERFYRVPGIERRSGSSVGLGLGLFICRTIIEQHQGEIGVESTSGIGSTFWFTLPLAV